MSALPAFTPQQLAALTEAEQRELLDLTLAYQRLTERQKLYSYYPDEGPLRRELYVKHCEFFAAGATEKERCMLAANRVGKAQPIDEPVLTPTGWRPIGSLRVGDKVVAGDGETTVVTGVFPQGVRPVFKVEFDDRTWTRCCAEHLWVSKQGKRERFGGGDWSVRSLGRIIEAGGAQPRPHASAMIPLVKPAGLGEAPKGIDPYLLGLLLGDGGLSRDFLRFSSADNELVSAVAEALPDGCELVGLGGCDYRVVARARVGRTSPIITLLREAGVWGARAWEKHVPETYLLADQQTRLAILQGLMDTDGSVSEGSGHVEFCTTSKQLADDVLFLLRSLGCKARCNERTTSYSYLGEKKKGRVSYRINVWTSRIGLFRLSRKAQLQRAGTRRQVDGKIMLSALPDGEAECVCISVANPSRTYVTRDWIVTHNTEGVGGYEVTLHLTGDYPSWWAGRRFTKATKWWAAGDTAKTVRDIIQAKLLGPPGDKAAEGTGLIPADKIIRTTPKQGIADAIEHIYVKHASGGTSVIQLKSYDQGREVFQGTEQDGIWLDEEPPLAIYTECVIRTMTTDGLVLCTFTPLEGLSETVLHYLPDGDIGKATRFVVMASWDDAPHLTKEQKDLLWNSIPPYQRDARSKGIPQLGSGAIYPVAESEVAVDPFEIPEHWPRVYALDVGWARTAAIWLALDRETQTAYAYSEHYRGQAEPSIHAESIRARGDWIKGVIDPAARGRSQADGQQLMVQYQELGLDLTAADNAVESGIYAVWQRLSGGRLKVFKTCQSFFAEYRLYRRDEKGRIVKSNDHIMDAVRYGIMSGLAIACTKPAPYQGDSSFVSDFA